MFVALHVPRPSHTAFRQPAAYAFFSMAMKKAVWEGLGTFEQFVGIQNHNSTK